MRALRICLALAVTWGCGDDDAGAQVENVQIQRREPPPPEISELRGVDLSALSASDRAMALRLVNDLTSPCGEPISVARCVVDGTSCRSCLAAARYLTRLAGEGYPEHEVRGLFQNRYDAANLRDIDVRGAPSRGLEDGAAVTIVVFSDFECPYCRLVHPLLQQILAEHPAQTRIVYKHYPLPFHERALPAAIASVAAQEQGKFWQMHDVLFEHQDALTDADLETYATRIGLDLARFRQSLEDEAPRARVERDREQGRTLEVQGTPSIFVNGRRFEEPLEHLSRYVREELDAL